MALPSADMVLAGGDSGPVPNTSVLLRAKNTSVDDGRGDDVDAEAAAELEAAEAAASLLRKERSRLPSVLAEYRRRLSRIESLERRMERTAAYGRRRAQRLLDETAAHRAGHLRVFVTHRCVVEGAGAGGDGSGAGGRREEDATPPPSGESSGVEILPSAAGRRTERSGERRRRKWTLIVEGRLLVGHLDHASAARFERDAAEERKARAEAEGRGGRRSKAPGDEDDDDDVSDGGEGRGPTGGSSSSSYSAALASTPTAAPRSGGFTGFTDREASERAPVLPLKLTHLFDRMEVEFRTVRTSDVEAAMGGGRPSLQTAESYSMDPFSSPSFSADWSAAGPTTTVVRGSGGKSDKKKRKRDRPSPLPPTSLPIAGAAVRSAAAIEEARSKARRAALEAAVPTEIVWERDPSGGGSVTEDSHAFLVNYVDDDDVDDEELAAADSQSEVDGTRDGGGKGRVKKQDRTVMATITLHRREGLEERYLPSRKLARALFPSFLPDLPRDDGDEDDVDRRVGGGDGLGEGVRFDISMSPEVPSEAAVAVATPAAAAVTAADDPESIPKKKKKKKKGRKKKDSLPAAGGDGAAATFTVSGEPPDALSTTSSPMGTDAVSLSPSAGAGGAAPSPADRRLPVDPLENDILIPPTLTLPEALSAIFLYARDRNLRDPTDMSLLRCDGRLSELFGCESVRMSDVRRLLLGRGLLMTAGGTAGGTATAAEMGSGSVMGRGDAPIVLKYAMTTAGAMPQPPDDKGVVDDAAVAAALAFDSGTTSKRKRGVRGGGTMADTSGDGGPSGAKKQKDGKDEDGSDRIEEEAHPNILSCDVDIPVPGLYHDRTRDLLRRIKRREYDHASSRTRALKDLTSSGGDEDTCRTRIEECVLGRGAGGDAHIAAWAALGRAAPAGSEARDVAGAGMRTAALVEEARGRGDRAEACWEVAAAVLCAARGCAGAGE